MGRSLLKKIVQVLMTDDQSKRCPCCKEFKSRELFYNRQDTKDGKDPYCKDCQRIKKREQRKQYAHKNQVLVDARLHQGCFVCHETDMDVLEFHHYYEIKRGGNQRTSKGRSSKYQRISTIKLNRSPKRMEKELAVCYVLCANDHKRVHARKITLPPPDSIGTYDAMPKK